MSPLIRVSMVVSVAMLLSLALIKPSNADPSMDMEGDGQASSKCVCTTKSCTGTLSASLSGPPLGKATLDLNLVSAGPTTTSSGCVGATGTGGLNNNAYTVIFSGQVCNDSTHSIFTINGAVQFVPHPEVSGTVGSGILSGLGALHLPCAPIGHASFPAATAEMVVGAIGVTGKIPLLVP
ncbi:MAG: hypothetical protein ACLQU2_15050 [Candidatus Binataceae bacterium]